MLFDPEIEKTARRNRVLHGANMSNPNNQQTINQQQYPNQPPPNNQEENPNPEFHIHNHNIPPRSNTSGHSTFFNTHPTQPNNPPPVGNASQHFDGSNYERVNNWDDGGFPGDHEWEFGSDVN